MERLWYTSFHRCLWRVQLRGGSVDSQMKNGSWTVCQLTGWPPRTGYQRLGSSWTCFGKCTLRPAAAVGGATSSRPRARAHCRLLCSFLADVIPSNGCPASHIGLEACMHREYHCDHHRRSLGGLDCQLWGVCVHWQVLTLLAQHVCQCSAVNYMNPISSGWTELTLIMQSEELFEINMRFLLAVLAPEVGPRLVLFCLLALSAWKSLTCECCGSEGIPTIRSSVNWDEICRGSSSLLLSGLVRRCPTHVLELWVMEESLLPIASLLSPAMKAIVRISSRPVSLVPCALTQYDHGRSSVHCRRWTWVRVMLGVKKWRNHDSDRFSGYHMFDLGYFPTVRWKLCFDGAHWVCVDLGVRSCCIKSFDGSCKINRIYVYHFILIFRKGSEIYQSVVLRDVVLLKIKLLLGNPERLWILPPLDRTWKIWPAGQLYCGWESNRPQAKFRWPANHVNDSSCGKLSPVSGSYDLPKYFLIGNAP